MPRKKLILTDQFPYHITNRANRKEFFDAPLELLWPIFVQVIEKLVREMDIQIQSFVLMDNHYHMILNTPSLNLSQAMTYFHREVAKNSNKITGKINHLFGGRYKWSLITNENYYWNAVKYIYRNPVEAGLCKKVEHYFYSSLNHSTSQMPWKLTDFFHSRKKMIQPDLDWLNDTYSEADIEAIQYGLSQKSFDTPKDYYGRRYCLPVVPGT